MRKIAVIAVHPDDEVLGCAGTILKHKEAGDEVYWIIVTSLFLEEGFNMEIINRRNNEINDIEKLFGFNKTFHLGFPTMKVDEYSYSEIIGRLSKIFNEIKPTDIYMPFKSDVHSDHRKIFEAVYSCTKTFRYPSIKRVYMMETLSETDFSVSIPSEAFIPNVFVDITKFFDNKIEGMRVYESEMADHPFPRSTKNIKALATYRGAQAGVYYAESFMLLKEIK